MHEGGGSDNGMIYSIISPVAFRDESQEKGKSNGLSELFRCEGNRWYRWGIVDGLNSKGISAYIL